MPPLVDNHIEVIRILARARRIDWPRPRAARQMALRVGLHSGRRARTDMSTRPRLLLDNGSDIEGLDYHGRSTPLMNALDNASLLSFGCSRHAAPTWNDAFV